MFLAGYWSLNKIVKPRYFSLSFESMNRRSFLSPHLVPSILEAILSLIETTLKLPKDQLIHLILAHLEDRKIDLTLNWSQVIWLLIQIKTKKKLNHIVRLFTGGYEPRRKIIRVGVHFLYKYQTRFLTF